VNHRSKHGYRGGGKSRAGVHGGEKRGGIGKWKEKEENQEELTNVKEKTSHERG